MADSITKLATSGNNGRRLDVNIESIRRVRGTPPNRINLPGQSAENQQAIPLQGQQDSFDVIIRLKTETSNVAWTGPFSEDGTGTGTTESITSIKDQYNFLYDEVLDNDIGNLYELRIDWLGIYFRGSLFIEDTPISGATFGQEILVTLRVDRGKNFIFTSLTS